MEGRHLDRADGIGSQTDRLPADVVWQAEFKQGNGVYTMYYDKVLGTTTYYCY